ncbi:MAG: DinB family protein [Pyrinomonadaceae bacterium]
MKTKNLAFLLNQLAEAPNQFEMLLHIFPESQLNWKPSSWEGIPSEPFSAIEQICHLHDIEIYGYQSRFQRIIGENNPILNAIDGNKLAEQNNYQEQKPDVALDKFRQARQQTIKFIKGFRESDFIRQGFFEGYGEVNLTGLIYFLRSHDLQHLSGLNWLLGKMEA